MEAISYSIPRKQADHRPVIIAPIGDIQFAGSRGPTAKETLRRHLDRCLELNAWYIGLGDYIDFLSPSNRSRMKAANLYDNAEDVIDDKAIDLTLELYQDFLKPTKGRWLGLLHGHHYAMLKTGDTTDQRLCQLLDARFLGTSAFIRLQFDLANVRANVGLWAHHGCGGGMTPGAPINRLMHMAARLEGVDVVLMGHTTKMPADRISKMSVRWHGQGAPEVVHRDVLLVSTGGFACGYVQGAKQGRVPMGGYAEQRMMNPSSLGAPLITIRPNLKCRPGTGGKKRNWAPEIKVEL